MSDEQPQLDNTLPEDTHSHDARPLEEALRDCDPRLGFLLDVAQLGVWEIDLTTGQASHSLYFHRLFGYEVVQTDWTFERFLAHVYPDDRARIAAHFQQLQNSAADWLQQYRIVRQDGALLWLEARGRTVRDVRGTPVRLMGTLSDITERKELEEALQHSESHYRSMIESIPSIVLMATLRNGCKYLNQRWYDYTGLTEEESLGRGWTRAIHPDDLERTLSAWREAVDLDSIFDTEYRFRRHDGVYRWFLGRIAPLRNPDGMTTAYLGILIDIDEQKQTEATLRQHQIEIETLNVRLRRAMQETHHRVKNNLQVISSLIEMQQDQTTDTIPAYALNRVYQHVRTLSTIHDLLTMQAKGDADLTHVSTRPLMHKLIALIQATMVGRKLSVELDDVRLTVKDGAALGLLVNELISNAIKHGRRDITLSLRRHNDEVRLEVCDDGPGFPPNFDPKKAAHTGLELIDSVARWDLRGEVAYQNREAGGARVVVTFPVSADALQPVFPDTSPSTAAQPG